LRPYGIIVPTLLEAEILIRGVAEREEVIIQGKPFHKGVLKNRRVVICICGIGKTNAAHGATLLIERFQPAFICLIGVAGAYPSSGLAIGDIVIGEKEIYGDEGLLLETGLQTMNAIGLPLVVIDGGHYFNEFPLHVPEGLRDHRIRGAIITISACTGTLKRGSEIETKFGALCENMEGAAVAHICLLNNVPAAEIRGISNVIEDRAEKPLDRSAIVEAADKVQMFFLERVI
jgi:futalosine hydrolase